MLVKLRGRRASTPRKEQVREKSEEKRNRGTEGETSYTNRAIDALIGDGEQGEIEVEQKEKLDGSKPRDLEIVLPC